MNHLTRRNFLQAGGAVLGISAMGFPHFVSAKHDYLTGDYPIPTAPIDDFVSVLRNIIPDSDAAYWQVNWQFAEDPYFESVVNADSVKYKADGEKLISIRLEKVPAGKKLYFKIECENCYADELIGGMDKYTATQFVVFPGSEMSAEGLDVKTSPTLAAVY